MAKVTNKLQVTLPKAMANQYGIAPGDDIVFQPAGDHILVLKLQDQRKPRSVEEQLLAFDDATARINATKEGRELTTPPERDWTRENLYQRDIPGQH